MSENNMIKTVYLCCPNLSLGKMQQLRQTANQRGPIQSGMFHGSLPSSGSCCALGRQELPKNVVGCLGLTAIYSSISGTARKSSHSLFCHPDFPFSRPGKSTRQCCNGCPPVYHGCPDRWQRLHWSGRRRCLVTSYVSFAQLA